MLSSSKKLSIDVSYDHVRPEKFFDPYFDPRLWRHGTIFGGQWRHQKKDRRKLSQHVKLEKNHWSRFSRPKDFPNCSLPEKIGPRRKNTRMQIGWFEIFFLKISFHSILEKRFLIIPWQRLKAQGRRCGWEIFFIESNEMRSVKSY